MAKKTWKEKKEIKERRKALLENIGIVLMMFLFALASTDVKEYPVESIIGSALFTAFTIKVLPFYYIFDF